MRACFFLALALIVLAPFTGISPVLAQCGQCEGLSELYNEYLNQMTLLKHFEALRDAGYPADAGSATGVVEGGTEAFHTDQNTSDCKIYKPTSSGNKEVTVEDIEKDTDYCPVVAKSYAIHEGLHKTHCRSLWRPHGTVIIPRKSDLEWRQYTFDDEIAAYKASTEYLINQISEKSTSCITERSTCIKECLVGFGWNGNSVETITTQCKRKCPSDGGGAEIINKINTLKATVNSATKALKNSTH